MNHQGLSPLGRRPLLWPTLGAIIGLVGASFEAWAPLVALTVLGLYLGLYHRRPPWVAAGVLCLLFAGLHNSRLKVIAETQRELSLPLTTELTGTVIESNPSGLVRRLFRTSSGARLSLVDLPLGFRTGQQLTLRGRLLVRGQPRNPGRTDFDEILHQRGIVGTFQVEAAEAIGRGGPFSLLRGWAEQQRTRLGNQVTAGIQDRNASDIVRAVVLGEKSSGSEAFDDFRKTGTMHIFAVSGLHVGLIALIVGGLGKLLRLRPRLVLWLVLVSMVAYAFITGLRPPAMRAALMGSIFLGRYLFRRPSSVINNLLAAALVVLALDSFQLWLPGFQLSFLVVAIIILLEPSLWERVAHLADQDPYLPKPVWTRWQRFSTAIRTKVGRMTTVSLAAWLGSSPLNIAYFGWFTPISSLASVFMVMGAFLVLLFALISLALAPFFPRASLALNQGNGYLALKARGTATLLSQIPGAWHRFEEPAPWQGGLCIFDVNFGGAALHLDAGGGVLIDSGNDFTYWQVIAPALDHYRVTCDSAVATHADAEHIGGLDSAVRELPIKQVLLPHRDRSHSLSAIAAAAAHPARVVLHDAGHKPRLPLDSRAHLEVLYGGDPDAMRADDRGLVLRLHLDGWRILITGDAGYAAEKALLESGLDLASDLWISGRNQNHLTGTDPFIRAVSPRVIVSTDFSYPAGEQVPPSWRQWLEDSGITFVSQREHGAVFVVPENGNLLVSSYLRGEITLLSD